MQPRQLSPGLVSAPLQEIYFTLKVAQTQTKAHTVVRVWNDEVIGIFRPQSVGHLQQKKFGNPFLGNVRRLLNRMARVWLKSGLLSSWIGEWKGGCGGWDVAVTQLSTYTASIWGGEPPRTPWMWSLCNATQDGLRRGNRGSSVALPSPFACLLFRSFSQRESDSTTIARYLLWIPEAEETVLLAYYRLWEHWDPAGERGEPLNNCANTGRSSNWRAWLQTSVRWKTADKKSAARSQRARTR